MQFTLKIGFCIAMGLCVLGGPGNSHARPRASQPIVCKADQTLTVSGRLINAARSGVVAADNCTLTIRDSDITGGRHGLRVLGNATVTIINSVIEGGRVGITISDNGDVKAKACTIIRGIRKRDNGDFEDQGDNRRLRRRPPVSKPAPVKAKRRRLKRAKPVRCTGTGHVTIRNKLIDTDAEAIGLYGTCSATIIGSHIRGNTAINLAGTGKIKIRNSTIEGSKAAIMVAGTGSVYAKRSMISGRIQIVGTGKYHDQGGNTHK